MTKGSNTAEAGGTVGAERFESDEDFAVTMPWDPLLDGTTLSMAMALPLKVRRGKNENKTGVASSHVWTNNASTD